MFPQCGAVIQTFVHSEDKEWQDVTAQSKYLPDWLHPPGVLLDIVFMSYDHLVLSGERGIVDQNMVLDIFNFHIYTKFLNYGLIKIICIDNLMH